MLCIHPYSRRLQGLPLPSSPTLPPSNIKITLASVAASLCVHALLPTTGLIVTCLGLCCFGLCAVNTPSSSSSHPGALISSTSIVSKVLELPLPLLLPSVLPATLTTTSSPARCSGVVGLASRGGSFVKAEAELANPTVIGVVVTDVNTGPIEVSSGSSVSGW